MTNEQIISKLKGYKGIIMYPTEEAEALKDAAIKALEVDYKTAFQIACALLNGDILYGTDAESIFSEIMKKDGCVCSFDYENYILTHLNELRDDKVLSQEPCEAAVSREAVRQGMIKYGFTAPDMTVHEFVEDELPSVTVRQSGCDKCAMNGSGSKYCDNCKYKQQTGEWILLDECANSGYYCSRCQKKLVKEGWSETVKKIKFCPNCGCRMVEPQESEE